MDFVGTQGTSRSSEMIYLAPGRFISSPRNAILGHRVEVRPWSIHPALAFPLVF